MRKNTIEIISAGLERANPTIRVSKSDFKNRPEKVTKQFYSKDRVSNLVERLTYEEDKIFFVRNSVKNTFPRSDP